MLQQLRDTAKNFVSYILLFLLVLSFGIWGIGDIFRNFGASDWVAKVGNAKISPATLQREFENESAQLRQMLGGQFTKAMAAQMGLLDRSLNQLITLTAMNMEINKLGLFIPREQIIRVLEKTPQLRNKDGSFNKQMFQQMIAGQGYTEATFIDAQKQIIARNMLVSGMGMAIVAPDVAMHDLAAAAAQKRVAEVVRIAPSDFPARTPSDADVQKYYDDNLSHFRAAERRSFKVLAITPADAAKDIAISDADLKAAYEEHKKDINVPEKRDIEQVVAESEEKAKAVVAAAKGGDLNAGAKSQGLEAIKLEAVTKADMPAELAAAVFSAGQNSVSAPVKTDLGWHVFVVKKVVPGKEMDFEAAKEPLRKVLRTDRAAESLVKTANEIDDMLGAGKNLDDIAAAKGLKVIEYDDRDSTGQATKGATEKLPFSAEVLRAAFQNKEGETSPLMESHDGGYVLTQVTKIMPAHDQPLAEVRDKVVAAWQKDDQQARARDAAKQVAEQMKAGKALSELTGGGRKSVSAPVAADFQGSKEMPREALAPLFSMKKGEAASVTTAEGEMVVRVKEIQPGDAADIKTRIANLKDKLAQDLATSQMDEYTHALRSFYPVQVDQKTMEQLAAPVNTGDAAM